jgi:peptide-methionine (S)-S-oxide reductase
MQRNAIAPGSIVTIDCDLQPEGDLVLEPLIDTSGKFSFVLGGGNYLPGLHDLISGMSKGEKVTDISLDAGWGERNPEQVVTMKKSQVDSSIVEKLKVGVELYIANGVKCTVTEITDDTFTLDANPPLAGASYKATVELLNVQDGPTVWEYVPNENVESNYKVATFALGCFWGGELEYMRTPGVVGTKVGYTQGSKDNPTYEEVCSGTTGHTEAIQIVFDPSTVSYDKLVHMAMDRLGENKYLLNQVGNDRGTQYRHGVYYHDNVQKETATRIIDGFGEDCVTECKPAAKFYSAEPYHQQYLLKGGQSARKNDDSVIRCYG